MGIKAVPDEVVPVRVKWRRVMGVCRKCSRKLDNEGFGDGGKLSLRKALKRSGGRRLRVLDTKCLGVCPWRGISVIDSDRPGSVLVVGPGNGAVERLLDAILPAGAAHED